MRISTTLALNHLLEVFDAQFAYLDRFQGYLSHHQSMRLILLTIRADPEVGGDASPAIN
jgi:hypothetical protein